MSISCWLTIKKQMNSITTDTLPLSIYTEKCTNFNEFPALPSKRFHLENFSYHNKSYKISSNQSLLYFSVITALSVHCEGKSFQSIKELW